MNDQLNEFSFFKSPEEKEKIKAEKEEKKLSKFKEKIIKKLEGKGVSNPIVDAVEQQIGYWNSDNKRNKRADRFEALLRSKSTSILSSAKMQIQKSSSIDEIKDIYINCKHSIASKLAELIAEEIKTVRSKDLTESLSELDYEIISAKEEKRINEEVSFLMKDLDIDCDDDAGLLELKYSETAESLREFNYDFFTYLKDTKDYSTIIEANNTISEALNLVETNDINKIMVGYETLATAKVILESKEKLSFRDRIKRSKDLHVAMTKFAYNSLKNHSDWGKRQQEIEPAVIEQREDDKD